MPGTALAGSIAVANGVGEGILWDTRRAALWWTDIPGCRLHRLDWQTGDLRIIPTPERLASFGLVRDSTRFIAAFSSGIAWFDPDSGAVDWIARPPELRPGLRFNDGRVDRRGRFWTGTMVEDGSGASDARLYCLDQDRLSVRLEGVRISNGLCSSPDGCHLYFADSPTGTIRSFALEEPGGQLGRATLLARSADGAVPDGATVDAEGCIWSAQWGGSCVLRYTPEGRIDRVLRVPASRPSCACFGGPDLDVLCVTSAREGLDAAALAREPEAGRVFLYRVGTRGLAEEEFRP